MAAPLARSSAAPQAALDALYGEHHRALYAYFYGHTADENQAADLLQETFLRAWRRIGELAEMEPGRERYWLFGVARNLLIDSYRRRAARPSEPLDDAPEPAAPAGDRDAALDLEAAIARLPAEQREALALSALGGLTSAEIGEALGRPAGTVRYLLSLARKTLSEQLGVGDRAKEMA